MALKVGENKLVAVIGEPTNSDQCISESCNKSDTVKHSFCNAASVTVNSLLIRPCPYANELTEYRIGVDIQDFRYLENLRLVWCDHLDFYPATGHPAPPCKRE